MARLEGDTLGRGPGWLAISPWNEGGEVCDATHYDLALFPSDDGAALSYRFSVEHWQMEQDDIWAVARSFMELPALMASSIPVDVWRTGRGRSANLSVFAEWIEFIFVPIRGRSDIRVVAYVSEGRDFYRRFFLQVSSRVAAEFGAELEREIIRASPCWARNNNHG